jgi:hypothetical protein
MNPIKRLFRRSAGRTAHYAARLTLMLDPTKPVAVAGNRDGKLQISGTDKESGRPFILILPAVTWPAVARAMGGHLAFLELQQRREAENCNKITAPEATRLALMEEFRGWCDGHGFTQPTDTPDTIHVYRLLTKVHYEFLDDWRERWARANAQAI